MGRGKGASEFYEPGAFRKLVEEICARSRLCESKRYVQHGTTSLYEHSILVAYYSLKLALRLNLPVNHKALVQGALLHDYFLYDWHIKDTTRPLHGFFHPRAALKNAEQEFELSPVEKNIILRHMFPLTPIPPVYLESILVCLVDKVCTINEIIRRNRSMDYLRQLE